jgi:hypothetical protein
MAGNPSTQEGRSVARYGNIEGRRYRTYRNGETLLGNFPRPSTELQCCHLEVASGVEFLIECPVGTTLFTVWYGRWVRGPNGLDQWVDDGFSDATSLAAGECHVVRYDNPGLDPVGMYIEDTDVASGESWKMWVRGI